MSVRRITTRTVQRLVSAAEHTRRQEGERQLAGAQTGKLPGHLALTQQQARQEWSIFLHLPTREQLLRQREPWYAEFIAHAFQVATGQASQ